MIQSSGRKNDSGQDALNPQKMAVYLPPHRGSTQGQNSLVSKIIGEWHIRKLPPWSGLEQREIKMSVSRRQSKIWLHSYSADAGLRLTSKVHPKAFFSINSRDLQYRRWVQEISGGVQDTPLSLYVRCTRHVDLSKPEHREKALTSLPFVFLYYLRESKGWAVPKPDWPVLNLIAYDWLTATGQQMVIPLSVPSYKALDVIELANHLAEIKIGLATTRPDLLPKQIVQP